MSTLTSLAIALVAGLVLYFLSSGVAFALMYRIGERFPNRAVGTLYEPLEWLSRRFGAFRVVVPIDVPTLRVMKPASINDPE